MNFSDLQDLLKSKLGIEHLADIARELNVSPQAVSNWKSRDKVPYKYIQKIRKEILQLENNTIEYSKKNGEESDAVRIVKNNSQNSN